MFVLPLRAAPDRRSLHHLAQALGRLLLRLAKRAPVHLAARWTDAANRSTISLPMAASRQKKIPSSAAVWMVDPFALAPVPTTPLATVKGVRNLLLIVRRLRVDDVTARRGRGSEEFALLKTTLHRWGTDPPSWFPTQMPRHDGTLDQILFSCPSLSD